MSISTFGSFTTARLGLYASQKALEITGNNIANINTAGYTRQVLQQSSLHVGGSDRYQTTYAARVGGGVLTTGVSQLRDPYLDIRFRNEQSSVGAMDAKLGGLEELASILDEVGKGEGDGVIERQFTDLITQIQNLATQGAGRDEYDALVRSSASTLVTLLNTYATKLDTIQQNQTIGFQQDIAAVNTILENIRDLSGSIRRSQIHGGDALELRDQRNVLIDELSKYMKIDVTYEQEDIGAGTFVEKLVIKLAGSPAQRATLVDGVYATQVSMTQVPDPSNPPDGTMDSPNFDLTLDALRDKNGDARAVDREKQVLPVADYTSFLTNPAPTLNLDGTENVTLYKIMTDADDNPVVNADGLFEVTITTFTRSAAVGLGDNDLYGALQVSREILTEKGEYASAAEVLADPNATTKRGIPYYQNMLDALANKFADVLNEANTLPDSVVYSDAPANTMRNPGYANYNGGNLFSNNGNGNDDAGITAANISISQDWAKGAVRVLQSTEPNFTSTDNSNLIHILHLMTSDQEYAPRDTIAGADDTVYFKGSFQKMLTNMTATLANDIKTTSSMLENYASASDELFVDRHAVAGVDLNDEAMGMMQFQKSYAAAARLLTTLDEMLDKLINGTGRAGL